MLTLISATPSPFARINRIAMQEKGIPFEVKNEIPWDSTSITPQYNPLEKLPILILEDGSSIYDSVFIQEYIIQKYVDKGDTLLPGDVDGGLQARQIQVLSEGIMDTIALIFAEMNRDEEKRSKVWIARQERKMDGALKALDSMVEKSGGGYLVGGKYTIADIAAGCAVAMVELILPAIGVRKEVVKIYPQLGKYWLMLEERESFKDTKPVMFEPKDFKL